MGFGFRSFLIVLSPGVLTSLSYCYTHAATGPEPSVSVSVTDTLLYQYTLETLPTPPSSSPASGLGVHVCKERPFVEFPAQSTDTRH